MGLVLLDAILVRFEYGLVGLSAFVEAFRAGRFSFHFAAFCPGPRSDGKYLASRGRIGGIQAVI
jgi:hypothetical protein